ncbi:hypothetical protein HMI54_013981 [Coelomomyces lativittatus]|nr:hypothetical protein HMI54_013981 [Coelomomyces lativittatus]
MRASFYFIASFLFLTLNKVNAADNIAPTVIPVARSECNANNECTWSCDANSQKLTMTFTKEAGESVDTIQKVTNANVYYSCSNKYCCVLKDDKIFVNFKEWNEKKKKFNVVKTWKNETLTLASPDIYETSNIAILAAR